MLANTFYDPFSAVCMGRSHAAYLINCQDAVVAKVLKIGGKELTLCVVLDGSGTTKHPEVGAWAAAEYLPVGLSRTFETELAGDISKPWLAIERLYLQVQQTMFDIGAVLGKTASRELFDQFIIDYCMFTILGFVLTEEWLVTFRAGDGVIVLNGKAQVISEQGNRPSYLGHSLLGEENPLRKPLAVDGFVINKYPASAVRRALVATDAFAKALPFLSQKVWECKSDTDLEAQLNILHFSGTLDDDGAIAGIQRRNDS